MSEIKSPEEGYINTSISMPKDILELLEKVAKEKHTSKSEILRGGFGLYLKELLNHAHPSEAGIYVNASGEQVHFGLLSDEGKAKVASGEWILKKAF